MMQNFCQTRDEDEDEEVKEELKTPFHLTTDCNLPYQLISTRRIQSTSTAVIAIILCKDATRQTLTRFLFNRPIFQELLQVRLPQVRLVPKITLSTFLM